MLELNGMVLPVYPCEVNLYPEILSIGGSFCLIMQT